MPTDAPTILATSGGFRDGRRTRWEFSALTEYAIALAGVTGRAPDSVFWPPRSATTRLCCTG